MTIPKTFSGAADLTWPHLEGYAPSIEDSLRYAVWLLFYADDVVRRSYSFDDARPERGIRIVQQHAHGDPETGAFTLPQLVIGVAIPSTTWAFKTGGAGSKRITIAAQHLEAIDTSWLDTDVTRPPLTPETRLGRFSEILMRGTLFSEAGGRHTSVIVDPYYSPLNDDFTYDAALMRVLSNRPPDIRPTSKRTFPNRNVRSEAEALALDPVRDFGLSYGLLATYEISVTDREDMRHGGDDDDA